MKSTSLLSWAALAGAHLVASAPTFNSTTCDATCQARTLAAYTWERDQHASPIESFYTIPANFSTALAPGAVLAVEPVTDLSNYTVPSPVTMSRLLFTSEDLNGTTVPASAYILWPPQLPKTGKAETVVFAHGTSGAFGACAPSKYRALQYDFQLPFTLALAGYVVVAPDYVGLGVDRLPTGEKIWHQWLAGPAQANDLANALAAARRAFSGVLHPKGPFVSIGHSQGATASWALAERQARRPIAGYRGAVAIAPPTKILDQLSAAQANATEIWAAGVVGLQKYMVEGVTAVFPHYQLAGMSNIALDRWTNVLEPLQGCAPTDTLLFLDVPATNLTIPGWHLEPTPQEWAKRIAVGGKKIQGPLLVIGGLADIAVPAAFVEGTFTDSCAANSGESLELMMYEGMNHTPLIQASHAAWMRWIARRFGRERAKKGCGRSVVKGFNVQKSVDVPYPTWLVASAGENVWQYLI